MTDSYGVYVYILVFETSVYCQVVYG